MEVYSTVVSGFDYTGKTCLNQFIVSFGLFTRRLLCSSGGVQCVCRAPRMPVGSSSLLPQTGRLAGQFGGGTGVSLLVRLPAAS